MEFLLLKLLCLIYLTNYNPVDSREMDLMLGRSECHLKERKPAMVYKPDSWRRGGARQETDTEMLTFSQIKYFIDVHPSSPDDPLEVKEQTYKNVSGVTCNFTSPWSTFTKFLSHNASSTNYVFKLHTGNEVHGEDIRDMTHLLSLLPLITEVHSTGLIEWLQPKDINNRNEILTILMSLDFVGDDIVNVEHLIRLSHIDKIVEQTSSILTDISTGDLIFESQNSSVSYFNRAVLSLGVYMKAVEKYIEKGNQTDTKSSIQSFPTIPATGQKWLLFAAYLVNIAAMGLDLALAIRKGDGAAIFNIVFTMITFTAVVGVNAYMLANSIVQGAKSSLMNWAFAGLSVYFSIRDIISNFETLTESNLSGVEKGLVITQIVISFVNIAVSIIAVALDVIAPGFGTLLSLVWGLVLVAWGIFQNFLFNKSLNKKLDIAIDAIDSRFPLTDKEKDKFRQMLKDGEKLEDHPKYQEFLKFMANENLVNSKLAELVSRKEMYGMVFPAIEEYECPYSFYENNVADLRELVTYKYHNWSPNPNSYRATCDPVKFGLYIKGVPKAFNCRDCSEFEGYKCENAIAIEYDHNRNDVSTMLFTLGTGEDTAYGNPLRPNTYLIESGQKLFVGGSDNDAFLLNSTNAKGSLKGGDGLDSIILLDTIDSACKVEPRAVSCGNTLLQLENIEAIIGRAGKPDVIKADCSIQYIQAQGGGDTIDISSISCREENSTLMVSLNGTQTVNVKAASNTVIYQISNDDHEYHDISINFTPAAFNDAANHAIFLNYTYDEYSNAWTETDSTSNLPVRIFIESNNGIVSTSLSPLLEFDSSHKQPHIVTSDEVTTFTVSREGLVYVMYKHNSSTHLDIAAKSFGEWTFLVNETASVVRGNSRNDTFFVLSQKFSGELIGGLGSANQLVVSEDFFAAEQLHYNLDLGLVSKLNQKVFNFSDISHVSTRSRNDDQVEISCNTKFVNQLKGIDGNMNVVIIPDSSDCSYDVLIRLEGNSTLINNGTLGEFKYLMALEDNISLRVDFSDDSYQRDNNHTFILDFGAREIKTFHLSETVTDGAGHLELVGIQDALLKVPIYSFEERNAENTTETLYRPVIITNETGILLFGENKTSQVLFNITEPTKQIIGAPFVENIFIINSSLDNAKGGNETDVFILNNLEGYFGELNGSDGTDTLILGDTYMESDVAFISFLKNESQVFLEIEEFVGRIKQTDIFIPNCITEVIDLGEGKDLLNPDIVVFTDLTCTFHSRIVYRNSTLIENNALFGNFIYNVIEQQGFFDFLTPVASLNHTVMMNLTQEIIHNVTFEKETLQLSLESTEGILSFQFQNMSDTDSKYPQPLLISSDYIRFSVDGSHQPVATFTVETNETIGFPFIQNCFAIVTSETNVTGGNFSDTFIFYYANKTAWINGSSDSNTLLLLETEESEGIVSVPFNYVILNNLPPEANIVYNNISMIAGRSNMSDTVIVDCQTSLIDLQGGKNKSSVDKIEIPNYVNCNYTTTVNIKINNFTEVENNARFGEFQYILSDYYGNYSINCTNAAESLNNFLLPYNVSQILSLSANLTEGDCALSVFILNETFPRRYSLENSDPCIYPILITRDFVKIATSPLFGASYGHFLEIEGKPIDDLKEELYVVAQRLNITLMTMVNDTKEAINIARNDADILQSHPAFPTHLIGSVFDNTYNVLKGENDTKSRVWIYGKNEAVDVIDLRQLARAVREHKGMTRGEVEPLYIPEITIVGNNLYISVESSPTSHPAEITLVDYREWINNTFVILHEVPMNIEQNNVTGEFTLIPLPFNVTNELTVIDEANFEDNQIIHIEFPCPTEEINTVAMYYSDHLVLTNAFANSSAVSNNQMFTVVFDDYMSPAQRNRRQKPKNIRIKLPQSAGKDSDVEELVLGNFVPSLLDDLLDVHLNERQKVEDVVFGFICKAEGIFYNPKNCQVYYECVSVGQNEFVQYEFTCPPGTIFCSDLNQCGLSSNTCSC